LRYDTSPEAVEARIDALASGVGIEKRAGIACDTLVVISSGACQICRYSTNTLQDMKMNSKYPSGGK
jgi:Fe-S cluster biogenesis protein NfuA